MLSIDKLCSHPLNFLLHKNCFTPGFMASLWEARNRPLLAQSSFCESSSATTCLPHVIIPYYTCFLWNTLYKWNIKKYFMMSLHQYSLQPKLPFCPFQFTLQMWRRIAIVETFYEVLSAIQAHPCSMSWQSILMRQNKYRELQSHFSPNSAKSYNFDCCD
jgi:hypothetical protein